MLKLNASYSKKVPVEGEYTSQSYHAGIEVELPDGLNSEQLKGKILETFALVRNRVEAELHGSTRDFAGSDAHGKVIIASRWRAFSTGLFFYCLYGDFC